MTKSKEENMATQQNYTNLVINNLPPNLTNDEFRSMFRSSGRLKTSKIIRDRKSKRSLGYGFVDYVDKCDADKAIATWNGVQVQNKTIKVANVSETGKRKTLYIKGLPQTVTQERLKEMFRKFGMIIFANVFTDKNTGRSNDFGFVLFDTRDQAEAAIAEMDGATPQGCTQPLLVKFAEDNVGNARPQAPPMPGRNPAIPTQGGHNTRGGYHTRGGVARSMRRMHMSTRGGYNTHANTKGGVTGPMRHRGRVKLKNPYKWFAAGRDAVGCDAAAEGSAAAAGSVAVAGCSFTEGDTASAQIPQHRGAKKTATECSSYTTSSLTHNKPSGSSSPSSEASSKRLISETFKRMSARDTAASPSVAMLKL